MQVVIKEIENRMDFEPFSNLHLVSELRCGMLQLGEKIEHYFSNCEIVFHCNNSVLFDSFLIRTNKKSKKIKENVSTLVLNSNVLINKETHKEIIKAITTETSNTIILDKKQNEIGCYFKNFDLSKMKMDKDDFKKVTIKYNCVINFIWELFDLIGGEIEKDFNNCVKNKSNFSDKIGDGIYLNKSAKIGRGVVFDSSKGKIIIDEMATVMPLSFIEGPCYIGKRTIIKAGAVIYKNCCFGPFCKIGGEIDNSIFQGYSNKQHNGFIGNSFVSEWVNIGAGTSNSDLKNNYSNVTIHLADKKIDTRKRFIGVVIGDHSKTAINTSLNTGSIIGIFSNVAKVGLTEKYIPPFSWISEKATEKYDLQRAILTAKVVMNRRHKELLFEEQQLISDCYMK